MAFKEFVEELYAPMGGVTVRAMFGGLGVFKDAVMFALAVDDVLYLRADSASGVAFAKEKSPQFIYKGMTGREVAMPYWRLPDRLLDDPDDFLAWSETAFAAAMNAATVKAKGKKPTGKAITGKTAASAKPAAGKRPAKKVAAKHPTAKKPRAKTTTTKKLSATRTRKR
jgi:DNA transformation protein